MKTITNLIYSALALLFTSAGLALVQPCSGAPFEWEATGSLITARYGHTATLLPNGKVLVAGGNQDNLTSTELYDPATGTWSATGNLSMGHFGHTATLLANGLVLAAAGSNAVNELKSAELFTP